jgi:sulfur relay (sulfurtransferase) complex TusBCD TusD component (DsrE family)
MSSAHEEAVSQRLFPNLRDKKLGVILYTMPTSPQFVFGVRIAEAALRRGYSVRMFAWGDSVYGVCDPKSSIGILKAVAELSSLLSSYQDSFVLDVCTTCVKLRGLDQIGLISGAHLGGLHDVVAMFRDCEKVMGLVP